MTKYTDFSALAAHYAGRLGRSLEPTEGEEAGDPCPQCFRRAKYERDDKGRWRLVMRHGPHKPRAVEGGEVPDIVPPRRVSDPYDYTDYLNED